MKLTVPATPCKFVALAGLLLTVTGSAAADVLVVDAQWTPGTFPTIESAVQAATDGDLILVKSGSYPSFYLDNKSLTITAAPGAFVQVTIGPRVVNLDAGKTVVLSGMQLRGVANTFLMAGNGLNLINNDGHVRVQDCTLIGANNLTNPSSCKGIAHGNGWHGLAVSGSSDVVVVNSSINGGRGTYLDSLDCMDPFYPAGAGANGAHLVDSNVSFYDCSLAAGAGGSAAIGADGGHGVRAIGATSFFLYDTGAYGGEGGGSFDFIPTVGGDGGNGIFTTEAQFSNVVNTLAADVQGGAPGFGVLGGGFGQAGAAVVGTSPAPFTAAPRGFDATAAVAVGGVANMTFSSTPGDFALLMLGGPGGSLPLAGLQGILHLAQPAVILPVGQVTFFGELSLELPVGPLPGGLDGLRIPMQSAFATAGAQLLLGPPRDVILVAAGL